MYIEKGLRSLSSAHEKWGQKQKCCVYNFIFFFSVVYMCVLCIFMYILIQPVACLYLRYVIFVS